MNQILLSLLFIILNFLMFPAHSNEQCASFFSNSREQGRISFKNHLENLSQRSQNQSSFIGKSVSFEEAVAFILSQLPSDMKAKYLQATTDVFWNKTFHTEPVPYHKIRLLYKNRFLNINVRRSDSAQVLWSSKTVESSADFDSLINATLDLLTESLFIPVRRTSVFVKGQSTFIKNNILLMTDKVILKLFLLHDPSALPKDTALRKTHFYIKSLLLSFLPVQFREFKNLRLTQTHLRIFETEGPQGLYKHLRWRYGASFAIRYWFTHLTNLKLIAITTVGAFLAPEIIRTHKYIQTETSVQFADDHAYELGLVLIDSMKKEAPKVLQELREDNQDLSENEKQDLQDFINSVETELPPNP